MSGVAPWQAKKAWVCPVHDETFTSTFAYFEHLREQGEDALACWGCSMCSGPTVIRSLPEMLVHERAEVDAHVALTKFSCPGARNVEPGEVVDCACLGHCYPGRCRACGAEWPCQPLIVATRNVADLTVRIARSVSGSPGS